MNHTISLDGQQENALVELAKRQSISAEVLLLNIIEGSLYSVINELDRIEKDIRLSAFDSAKVDDTKEKILTTINKK